MWLLDECWYRRLGGEKPKGKGRRDFVKSPIMSGLSHYRSDMLRAESKSIFNPWVILDK